MAKEQNPEMRIEYYQCYTWHGLRYILFHVLRSRYLYISRTNFFFLYCTTLPLTFFHVHTRTSRIYAVIIASIHLYSET